MDHRREREGDRADFKRNPLAPARFRRYAEVAFLTGATSSCPNAGTAARGSAIATLRAIALLPSFLCLDAPFVALGWALLLAADLPARGGPWDGTAGFAALFLAVWTVYLGDRLLDAVRRRGEPDLPPRQLWARRHQPLLGVLLLVALAGLVLGPLPRLDGATWRAGFAVAGASASYFVVFRLHRRLPGPVRLLPAKELWIGAVFAAGVAIAAAGGRSGLFQWAAWLGMGLLFAGNCLLIARCEELSDRCGDSASYFARPRRWRQIPELFFAGALVVGALGTAVRPDAVFPALVLGSAASLALGRWRGAGQASADAVLLVPWIFLAVLG